MKYTDCMIDLETLSTRWDATILSIGYQFFTPSKDLYGPAGEILVEFKNNVQDRHVLKSTETWWSEQGEDAQRVLHSDGRLSLADALELLTKEIVEHSNAQKVQVWGNGSVFDITILDHAFRTVLGRGAPWQFRFVRDVRTIVEVGRMFSFDPKKTIPFTGVKHNAADDAKHEASYVTEIVQLLQHINKKG